jgi:hypothetical protein
MKRCPHCGCQNADKFVSCGMCGEALATAAPQRIAVQCLCGETYYATDDQIGRKIKCSRCLRILVVGILVVGQRNVAAGPKPLPTTSRTLGSHLSSFVLIGMCGLLLAGVVGYQVLAVARLNNQLEAERAEGQRMREDAVKVEQDALAAEVAAEESAHQGRLQDRGFISGAAARQRHEDEWARRLKHDPGVATTVMETKLLRMEQVGRDPAVAAQAALEEVARLAAPPGSRVEVTPSGERFTVKVAFRMSALSANEAGAVTKHHTTGSMRREIEDLSARVMRDLFDYCGTRGIEKISVSCNHALRRASLIPVNATAQEKEELLARAAVTMGNLYRAILDHAQARAVPDWRQVSMRLLNHMMKVEYDGLQTLKITGANPDSPDTRDPEGPLEF